MSSLLLSALATGSSGQRAPYVDDVFSTYLYTGNGSTQTINNGIDLAGEGGLVWSKQRNGTNAAYADNLLIDTVRGRDYKLHTNSTTPNTEILPSHLFESFNTTGYTVNNYGYLNSSNSGFVSWTFRCSERFFDVVTYTGNGTSNRNIPHSLGITPGMVIVKNLSQLSDWYVYHRSAAGDLTLNQTGSADTSRGHSKIVSVSSSSFVLSDAQLGSIFPVNNNGDTFIAYVFAHDPTAEGIIQCGSYTGNGSATGPEINLGWEPQYLLIKNASSSANWVIQDVMRGFDQTQLKDLAANLSNAEDINGGGAKFLSPTATGFSIHTNSGAWNGSGNTYIYLAIRRPNKPPTSGTQVYNAIARAGTGAAATVTGVGFAPDLVMCQARSPANLTSGASVASRLIGTPYLRTSLGNSEINSLSNSFSGFLQNGISIAGAASDWNDVSLGTTYINHFFRRATGFFDVVCDTGTGAAHAIAHNLTKVPELIIRKSRSAATQWEVWHSALAATEKLVLNGNAAKVTDATAWNSTLPTATQITVGTGASVNANTATFVTYLFATLDGISKVGSYTGNGSTLNIDAGFGANGPAFILIKRTDSTGDWYLWDSARGIVSGNDPHLSLNTTAAEVTTDDSVDPTAGGFAVNQNTATNINVSGGQYIYLAIAGGVYVPSGEAVFTTPGTYNWTVPEGVTSVSVVCVGAGGGSQIGSGGAGGGALVYKNNVAVTPGASVSVVVGATNNTSSGGSSSFSTVATAYGGGPNGNGGVPGNGGSYTGGDGGGSGGSGGSGGGQNGGGGGAGGYAGSGGSGGNNGTGNGSNGAGGGGGGGGGGAGGSSTPASPSGGGGGGVGLYGQGANGTGGAAGGTSGGGQPGTGGSGGTNGTVGTAGSAAGLYGGGAAYPGSSGGGAVRIIWGYGRSFPYNAA